MAQIYQGNKFRTSVTQSARGNVDVSNLANRGVQETLDRKKAEAVQLYEQGLKLFAAQGMEEIYKNNENDPVTLKAELNKLNEKMTSEIPDMRMKVAFKTNFILQSGSLVNRAQANYDKIQYQKKKSSYFDTIQANNKAIATALNNAFNGTGTADDLANYQIAIKQNLGLINARNDDGTYMFTDAQRLSMSNAVDKLAAESFSAALNEMDDNKRQALMDDLENDNFVMLKSEKDGTLTELNLKDAFSPEVYSDMKKSAKILDNKIKKEELAEWRQNKAYSAMALMKDPSEENYKIWEYYNQDASDAKKKTMQEIAGFVPDEETETNFESVTDFIEAMKNLSKYNVEKEEDVAKFMNDADSYIYAAMKANKNRDENNNPKISDKDLKNNMNDMFEMLNNKTVVNLVNKMPDGSWFEKAKSSIGEALTYPKETIQKGIFGETIGKDAQAQAKISKIGMDTMVDVKNLAFGPLEDGETEKQREEKIRKRYQRGKEDAIQAKYWYIEDIQMGLIDGRIYEINGRLYKYNGDSMSWEMLE